MMHTISRYAAIATLLAFSLSDKAVADGSSNPTFRQSPDIPVLVLTTSYYGSPQEKYALASEAHLIAQFPGIAKRSGDQLLVTAYGHSQIFRSAGNITGLARPEIPGETSKCDGYVLKDVLRLATAFKGTVINVPEIQCALGEHLLSFLLPKPDGTNLILEGPAMASPDGRRLIVMGHPDEMPRIRGTLIYSAVDFQPEGFLENPCQPITWVNAVHFTAHCQSSVDFYDADVWLAGDGLWHVHGSQWLDYDQVRKTFTPESLDGPLPDFAGQKGPTFPNIQMSFSNRWIEGGFEKSARVAERPKLAIEADIVHREGNNLVITYANEAARVFAPLSEPPSHCDAYIYMGNIGLFDDKADRVQRRVELTCHAGEFSWNLIVLPGGQTLNVTSDSAASPDGKVIATGKDGWLQNDYGRLSLSEWPSRRPIARFDAGCTVTGWSDNRHFRASCTYDPTPTDPKVPFDIVKANDDECFDAVGALGEDGKWRLHADGYQQKQLVPPKSPNQVGMTVTMVPREAPIDLVAEPAGANDQPYLPMVITKAGVVR